MEHPCIARVEGWSGRRQDIHFPPLMVAILMVGRPRGRSRAGRAELLSQVRRGGEMGVGQTGLDIWVVGLVNSVVLT